MKIKIFSKKFAAIVLSLAVLGSTLMLQSFSAFADETATEIDVWDGTEAESFDAGSGTKADPWEIRTPEQFALFGSYVRNQNSGTTVQKYFKLTADIYLNDVTKVNWSTGVAEDGYMVNEWTYGAAADRHNATFDGYFDGNRHVVRGIYIKTDQRFAGLFPALGWYFLGIANLGIESSYMSSTATNAGVGAIAGDTNNAFDKSEFYIENCYVADTVTLKSALDCGGFIGNLENQHTNKYLVINNCYSSASVTGGSSDRVGSLIGDWYGVKGLKVNSTYATQTGMNMVGYVAMWAEPYRTDLVEKEFFTDCYTAGTNAFWLNYNNTGDANHPLKGVTVLTAADMTGGEALKNMPGLSSDVWTAYPGVTPKLNIFGYEYDWIWDGKVADAFAGGSGTKTDPYKIETGGQLALLCQYALTSNNTYNANSKYYKLTADIYLNDITKVDWTTGTATDESYTIRDWSPYGSSSSSVAAFNVNIDGNGHVIRGIHVVSDATQVGLFSRITSYGQTIKNLGIESSYLESTNTTTATVAPFGGATHNWVGGTLTFENCYAADTVTVKANTSASESIVGGFLGNDNRPTTATHKLILNNCYTSANLIGNRKGSIFGQWYSQTVMEVNNTYATQTGVNMIGYTVTWSSPRRENLVDNETFVNCYTLGKNQFWLNYNSTGEANHGLKGVSVINADHLKGSPATRLNLDYENTWYIPDENSYPLLRVFNTGDTVQVDGKLWNVWDGTVATAYDGGSGTAIDPFLISNGAQLAKLVSSDYGSGKYYKLTDDIYLNDVTNDTWYDIAPNSWAAYGLGETKNFKGTLDGDGHVIYGIYIKQEEADNAQNVCGGIFGSCIGNATIKNLGISKSYIVNNRNNNYAGAGAFVGACLSGTLNFSNCFVDNTVTIKAFNPAGFVGYVSGSSSINIDNSYSGAQINKIDGTSWSGAANSFVSGGVSGGKVTISNSYSTSDCGFSAANTASNRTITITDCYATDATEIEGVSVLTKDAMLGDAMTNLGFGSAWRAVANSLPMPAVFTVPGDVDGDEAIDICDLVKVKKYVADNTYKLNHSAADLDRTRAIDDEDLANVRKVLFGETLNFQ